MPESALSEFYAEADEIIQRVNSHLSLVENEGLTDDAIDSLYRDIHTLKGSAQLFGFKNIGMVAHAVEASLEPIRKKKITFSPLLLDYVFKCLDFMDRILKSPNLDLEDNPTIRLEVQTLVPKLISVSTGLFYGTHNLNNEGPPIAENNLKLIHAFDSEKTKKNTELNSNNDTELNQIVPPTISSPSKVSAPAPMPTPTPAVSPIKAETQTQVHVTNQPPTEPVKLKNESEKNQIHIHKDTQATLNQTSENKVKSMPTEIKMSSSNNATAVKHDPTPHHPEGAESNTGESSTIRVQVGLLDKLMNLVGEMVLVRNQVLQFSLNSDDYEFLNLSQRLDLVTSELQEDVMKTRMQPIGSILTKFQRVVRDLSRDLGKQIELIIKGAETEIDKSLLEAIKDPLTHIIRNSCDHGLELPDERRKNGKDETGHILIRSFHEGGQVVIEIKDDGRGLNNARILNKAIEKKIISPERAQQLTEREISYLIFAPGFSTADTVSAISGRGVGMDVVRTNIEKVGGIVDLASELGKGTTLRLRIPLTLAIVPAMIVKSGSELFAIPQVKLQELVRIDMDDSGPKVELLQGQPVYRLRGHLLPLVFMDQVLGLRTTDYDASKKKIFNVVVLTGDGEPFGLVVDEIRDTADIVVKPLSPFLKKINVYSGATIMGDGTVSLIVDVMGIGERANVINQGTKKQDLDGLGGSASKKVGLETQELLFFELNAPGKFCLPLVLVQRLEEFKVEDIETSGKERIVKYRDSILPLINLNSFLKYENKDNAKPKADKISVVVVSKRRRFFGIEVNQILDVLDVNNNVEAPLKESVGILGSIIVGEQIATVIDVLAIIEEILGHPDEQLNKKTQKALTAKRPDRPIKVLYAEDTIFFVRQVTRILENAGYEVVHAADGELALKTLKASPPGTFDLILSDIEMPNLNGFGFAKAVRKEAQYSKIPMIALTTRFKESDVKEGSEAGFNRYLEKIKTDQLLDAIREEAGGKQ